MKLDNKKTLKKINFFNKTVVVRVDYNVPIVDGKVSDDTRIRASLDTLKYLLNQNAKLILLSHLGRVKTYDDVLSKKYSLKPVYEILKKYLENDASKVDFLESSVGDDVVNYVKEMQNKNVVLLENTRYNDVDSDNNAVKRESKNDPELGKFWASLAQVFVNDAFGTAHRAHASNVGIAKYIEKSCVGFLIEKELNGIGKVINSPKKPLVIIMGGAKVSDKIGLVKEMLVKADHILISGGIATNFLYAKGYKINKDDPLIDLEMMDVVKNTIESDKQNKIVYPVDFIGSKEFVDAPGEVISVDDSDKLANYKYFDIGPKTCELFRKIILQAKTVAWNGPVGVFEFKNYQQGCKNVASAIAETTKNGAYSMIGGGDSVSAVVQFGYENDVSFISTGGGASLELLEGVELPGIACIEEDNTDSEDKGNKLRKYSKHIDHTFLAADATDIQISQLCKEAVQYDFYSVCVNPCWVKFAKEKLFSSDVKVTTVVGFPLGQNTTKTKLYETKQAIRDGADEIDMVINISELKANCTCAILEIRKIKKACKGRILKVIIETSLLTDKEKERACKFILDAGADFVKTSTGFSGSGATVEDVKLLKKVVEQTNCKIKASGGIKTADTFLTMVDAGADRIGSSSSVKIIDEIKKKYNI